MDQWINDTPVTTTTAAADDTEALGAYPLPCFLKFCPGGVAYPATTASNESPDASAAVAGSDVENWYRLYDPNPTFQRELYRKLIQEATTADDRLRKYALHYHANAAANPASPSSPPPPFAMPSLSVLAEAAFGRLTGVPHEFVKEWADAMVLQFLDAAAAPLQEAPTAVVSEEDIWNAKPKAAVAPPQHRSGTSSLAYRLKEQLRESSAQVESPNKRRPCGYVFKRGDIAWNCRTCQTDATCVICDNCFRLSDHEGHEVYFHRTSPGGCCDCGDAEAWKIEGCCPIHRPDPAEAATATNADDPLEAVRMAVKGQEFQRDTLTQKPTALPPATTAALATVIGAAVAALVKAVDGAGVGADPSQFKTLWAHEAALVAQGHALLEESYVKQQPWNATPQPSQYWAGNHKLPKGYQLHLRLHNDDVHTFDEVIDALHQPRSTFRRGGAENNNDHENQSLVPLREQATEMTHHVDADGQVTVRAYDNCPAALQGFRRLKTRGLHCALVSTPQVNLELRAKQLAMWLTELASAHPVAAALTVHALVQVDPQHTLAGYHVWHEPHIIPTWTGVLDPAAKQDEMYACRRRFEVFPPHLVSSYCTREEGRLLHGHGMSIPGFLQLTSSDPQFYARGITNVLPAGHYRKSPHALWGTLPALYNDSLPPTEKHPLLKRLAAAASNQYDLSWQLRPNQLTESVYVVDTDLRKQQEADRITSSVFPHKLPGLHLLSGLGTVAFGEDGSGSVLPNPMDMRHLLAISSFRAPMSNILILLLLDPYPTKQLRGATHALFLSLLTDSRFKCRFAGAFGLAYRPLSTLFCAGVGTEADTPLHFSVQILTAGSLVRALGQAKATEQLLISDAILSPDTASGASTTGGFSLPATNNTNTLGVFCLPIAHTIVRCIHTNLLGATKEVNMILNNTQSGNDSEGQPSNTNDALLPALTYVAGEHPLMTLLPAAPDDGFLDSRSTRHKRLPHLLRDLEYVIETPGTAIRLLLPSKYPVHQGPSPLSLRGEDILAFPTVFARMLRLAQGMDPQKRKISGGHVEYEQNRWLEAFGLSLNIASSRDALAESPAKTDDSGTHLFALREAMGNLNAALIREIKLWLYREGMLETGFPIPSGGTQGPMDLAQAEALQRSTLHVSGSTAATEDGTGGSTMVALSCATGVKMTENQLGLIENALKVEEEMRNHRLAAGVAGIGDSGMMDGSEGGSSASPGLVMGDWLRVPHSPLAGDSLSFHLPLHRALAKSVRSICSVVVPEQIRNSNPSTWWRIPVLDDDARLDDRAAAFPLHPLVQLVKSTLRSSNCRVVWMLGPDCTPQEAQRRRTRSRNVSANIAVTKVIHSLADHPIRCLAAAQQIERHLWARNGSSVAGMAMNYTSTPLCRAFRDLDLLLVQLSASGLSIGLGARRVFQLLLSRFNMDGHLCDPERRTQAGSNSPSPFIPGANIWVNPPRLQDPDHAVVLSESFFTTLCVLVTELPPPPPRYSNDNTALRQSIRRELLHALASEPRSRSEAMTAAALGVTRREESEGNSSGTGNGGLFRETFAEVLDSIGKQKSQGTSRVSSGPPAFELKSECCDEYDPTFFHLRRQEHQHAMDLVARLRRQKLGKDLVETHCFPLVCPPPKAHPRFLPCRLLLHLPGLDAAIRRSLLFALTNGSWLPPAEPIPKDMQSEGGSSNEFNGEGLTPPTNVSMSGDVVVTAFNRRGMANRPLSTSSLLRRQTSEAENSTPFSKQVVAQSSVSFIEVLQLLTLQAHTLEECASLHRTLPDLDEESRLMSSGLSINTYLSRLAWVPESLIDVWALRPHPQGPLDSKGSGEMRGSVLGLLVALYEHRSDHGATEESDEAQGGDEGHGGARALASSGLKWLLRFVNALVDGATSVGAAAKSATSGVPVQSENKSPVDAGWTIDEGVRVTISSMLKGLPDLWPVKRTKQAGADSAGQKSKEAGKAAQKRMMAMMMAKQRNFAATIDPSEAATPEAKMDEECIICRCDDADGENNGPLGYLGHVQRSRVAQMRAIQEADDGDSALIKSYRVVGHMGCQLRETDALDSKPLSCLPRGSVVTVMKRAFKEEYGIRSRRVLVRHVKEDANSCSIVSEGWASVMSSQGYVILSPLVSLCYTNSKWGATRPIIKQCGHVAHLKCVETHTLSLHQRAAGEQPYDGRFAANIADGEFLCPLCKQLSNILIPRDSGIGNGPDKMEVDSTPSTEPEIVRGLDLLFRVPRLTQRKEEDPNDLRLQALEDFGSHLYQAMEVSWDRTPNSRKKQQKWHPAIRKWDYEEEATDESGASMGLPRMLRQQLIAFAAIGHTAAAAEAGSRGVEEVLPFGVLSKTSDPWNDYTTKKSDSHPMLLELKRTLSGASGLLEALCSKLTNKLESGDMQDLATTPTVLGCLGDILAGNSWILSSRAATESSNQGLTLWTELTSLTAALPCHVARDGVLSLRCEARATAASMWAAKGSGGSTNYASSPSLPLAVRRVLTSCSPPLSISDEWGSVDPVLPPAGDLATPFRLGIACGYLYTPLLAWDLNTFAGASFSSLLLHDLHDLPNSAELVQLARMLLCARIVQAIVVPGGLYLPEEYELEDEECWTEEENQIQGMALVRFVAHCRAMVEKKMLDPNSGLIGSIDGLSAPQFLAGVGRAILPFARSLLLLLRATVAVAGKRREKGSESSGRSSTESDKLLESFIFDQELMECEDGFFFLKALQGPTPAALIDASDSWIPRVNRWLVSLVGFEMHQGSSGRSLLPLLVGAKEGSVTDMAGKSPELAMEPTSGGGTSEKPAARSPHQKDEVMADVPPPDEEAAQAGSERHRDMQPAMVDFMVDVETDEAEMDEDMDEAEEMVEFPEALVGGASAGSGQDDAMESSDENSESGSEDGGGGENTALFANVGTSPIIPYQPPFLGLDLIGPGRHGAMFEYSAASAVMADLSHLALVHRKDVPTFGLTKLPKSFVELYNIVSNVKGREENGGSDEQEDVGNTETAICLLTGTVMRSGSPRRSYNRSMRPPGSCTLHARKHGSGIGIFFLVQKCTVLLMHNNKSAYSPSIYVDEHGEEDPGLRRGRPLFLNNNRYRALEVLWRQQLIPREVAQIRSTSDRVIRDNWY
mmetsp:Transcript_11499/g.25659  ORF Transcript_11499/g.25659 Transcript_11499/m.25659 type:complete len:3095 (-) Transcript_11499:90-9374(-)